MGMEDTFNGAMTAMTFFNAYENTVVEEIGEEQMLNMLTKMCETMGAMQGTMMKEQAGTQEIDAKTAWSMVRSVPESLGMGSEVMEESPEKVVAKMGRCPIYTAAQMLGVDVKTMESRCRGSSVKFMDSVVKQLNPNFRYELRKFRKSADDFCEEAIVKA